MASLTLQILPGFCFTPLNDEIVSIGSVSSFVWGSFFSSVISDWLPGSQESCGSCQKRTEKDNPSIQELKNESSVRLMNCNLKEMVQVEPQLGQLSQSNQAYWVA